MVPSTVTRGRGLLEPFLARMRAERADSAIPARLRQGNILDIGCGTTPYFLLNTRFSEKHGLDRIITPDQKDHYRARGIALHAHDLETAAPLPFADGVFDVVTMLAVLEHIRPERLPHIISDIRRVVKPGGMFFLTTPASWMGPVVTLLCRTGMLSREEIEEHQPLLSRKSVRDLLLGAGFDPVSIRVGSFECGMNMWAQAISFDRG